LANAFDNAIAQDHPKPQQNSSHSLADRQNAVRILSAYIVVLARVLYRVMGLDTRSVFVSWRAAILAAVPAKVG